MKILESFIASPFAAAIGWTLLHSLWEGAATAAILAAIVIAVRSPRVRYGAACVAMLTLVAAFSITLFRLWPDAQQMFPRFRPAVPFAPTEIVNADANSARWWIPNLALLAPWLAPFWIAGVCLLSLQRIMSCLAIRRLRSRGVCFASEEWHVELARLAAQLRISRPVHLLESCVAEIPMVLGHLRPVVLVPVGVLAGLPAEQVETILLHELAHIRRCDYLVNVCQRVIEGILFYHPAVWWISKVIRTERENCCDDVVVSVTRHSRDYALALAALERNRVPGGQAAVAATGGTLVKRIRRLLYPKAPAGIWAPILAAVILFATTAVSFAALQPKSTPIATYGVETRTKVMVAPPRPARKIVSDTNLQGSELASPRRNQVVTPFVIAPADGQGSAGTSSTQGEASSNGASVQLAPASPDSKWLNEDVVYIITDEERDAFLHLKTDEEREQFIKQFWERRNPIPGSADNKFKDEHYRRIAYANEHFSTPSGKPGWQTDRGHIYIVYGPPDVRSENLAGENGSQFASEEWRYNHIDGVGDNLVFEFIDRGGRGDFTLAPAPTSGETTPRNDGAASASETREPSLQGVKILSPTEGVNFGPYLQQALKSIQLHWYKVMPEEAMKGTSGRASVILAIAPDGKLSGQPELASGSGIPDLDKAAVDAVRNSSPLNPLPKDFHGPQLKLEISFFYNENARGQTP
jgi:TonB family protein